jgi:hypothetical protein
MSDWFENMGIPSLEDLKDSAKTMLIQQLGVDKFLLDTPCSTADEMYTPSVHGWKNGEFLLDTPCSTADEMYTPSVHGWKNGEFLLDTPCNTTDEMYTQSVQGW